MSETQIALLIAALGFAGTVKGVTGMGLPLFATPILASIFGARPAVVIMSIPVFASNLLLIVEGRRGLAMFRDVWVIAVAGAFGVAAGVLLLKQLDQNLLALLIAALVIVFLGRGDRLLGSDPKALRMRVMGPLVGWFSGVLNGTTSIASPLVATYLHARHLAARDYVVSLALIFQVFGTVQIAGLWAVGLYDVPIVTTGLLGLVPTLGATVVGARLRRRLDNATFRRVVVLLLAVSAVNLFHQGLCGFGAPIPLCSGR